MNVLSDAQLNTIRRFWFIMGCMLGVWFALAVQHVFRPEPPIVDTRMERLCRWPQQNGETSVGFMLEGKLTCFVHR